MEVLVVPDVHLKPYIFDKASALLDKGDADKAVCLMDIPDDWKKEMELDLYEKTFDRAIKFQKDHPDTLWCYGNHDLSYVWTCLETGFSPYAISMVNSKLNLLKAALPSLDQIAYIHRIDNVLFIHGGLSDVFIKIHVDESKRSDVDKVIKAINKLGVDEMWNEDSPIWFRPQYSDDSIYGEFEFTQVVGHTPVKSVNKRGSVISCDVFSTHKDGSPIGSCDFTVIDTLSGEFRTININEV